MARKRGTSRFLAIAMTAALLAGCSMKSGDTPSQAEPVVIKVMYYDERSFFDQYGMLFSALHPDVEIEVVNTQSVKYEPGKDMDKAMMEFIEQQKPDIMMLSADQYTKMAEDGKLLELDSRIEEKGFKKEGLMPGMLDYLKDLSGGKLYGLVPDFYGRVVYYNKDLFEKHHVDLPKDKMSWDELLRLAAMFPTDGSKDNRVYGMSMNYGGLDLYQLANMIGVTQNLNIVDATAKQVTINSDAWKKVFGTALNAMKSGALYTESPNMNGPMQYEDYLLQNPFIAGKAAMTIEGNYLMGEIKQAQEVVKDKAIKNWDIVTMPVDPANPDVSPNVSLNNIFAVSAQSGQIEASWKFLSYITSDEFARVTSKRQTGSMPVRTQYLKDDAGHHFEAFYSLKPVQPAMYKSYSKLPDDFFMKFQEMAQQEMQAASSGQKSLDEALNDLQTKAQEALAAAPPKESPSPSPAASGG
ncbi:ABC transporter substrate-binding protein [Cohnella caldifontis]|uniref:ABC transporter substrate-binding protein n=1 Tax=Cohnella caldifontis TaxID=3027471 RepID=UPI0023EAE5EB|nr:extracellular solute-binding protein [Cohnella sp. YIM B05605]